MNPRYTVRTALSLVLVGVLSSTQPQLAIASPSDSGTLTVGSRSSICIAHFMRGNTFMYGYNSFGPVGVYSPTGLTGGFTVEALEDLISECGGEGASLQVSGFAANPGSQWLISVTCNGIQLTSGTATSFQYSGGVGFWSWSVLFGFQKLSQTSCTIVHN